MVFRGSFDPERGRGGSVSLRKRSGSAPDTDSGNRGTQSKVNNLENAEHENTRITETMQEQSNNNKLNIQ